MNNVINQVSYLPTTRIFPENLNELSIEINRSYIDIANAVNNRSIGIYSTNRPALTGDAWYLNGVKQQSIRQFFPFTTNLNFFHNLNVNNISQYVKIYGTYQDAAGNSYPLPNNQTSLVISPTHIVITLNGAPVPIIGVIVLEWLSKI